MLAAMTGSTMLGGELHVSRGGEPEREGVGDGEGGNLQDERLPFSRHEKDAEDKENVVQSIKQKTRRDPPGLLLSLGRWQAARG
jgi:hypothetical protein